MKEREMFEYQTQVIYTCMYVFRLVKSILLHPIVI